MVTFQLGLFDIMQHDPLDPDGDLTLYGRRLDDLAYAESIGFDLAFTGERHFLPIHQCTSSTAWLGALSQRTSSMRIGALAWTLPINAPVRLAEEIAVLDRLSGGRLEVGVGLGHRAEELVALGVDPANRIPIFQQRLAIMEALWSGNRVSVDGILDQLADVSIHPLPVQQPHPPIWYAGLDVTAATWAGQHGASLAIGFAPTPRIEPAATAFTTAAATRADLPADGRRPGEGRLALMRHVYISDDDARARNEMIDDLMRLTGLAADAGSRPERRADAEREVDRLISQEIYLAGSPARVAGALVAARNTLGITAFLANPWAAGLGEERVRRTMRLLAGEVRERLEKSGREAVSAIVDPA